MKKLILTALLLPLMMVNAQKKEQTDYKNSIQFDPLNPFIFGTFEFQYERAISDKSTLLLGVGLKPLGGLITVKGFDSPTIKTDGFKFIGFTVTPEYRWYFQKDTKAKRTGLYVGAYYKYRNVKAPIIGNYTSSNTNTTSPIDVSVGLQTHSLGAVLGYKVMLSKKWYIDILIAGPAYSLANINFKENKPLPAEFYVDAADVVLDNLDVVKWVVNNVNLESLGNSSGKGGFYFPTFRYGFKIGYSF